MNAFSRADYDAMSRDRISAFRRIADRLGKENPVTKMMGSLARGRHKAEQGPEGNLRTAVKEYGFLEGYFDALNLWARDHDYSAQRVMLEEWPTGMRRANQEPDHA
jgi:hypothetical protein